MHRHNILKIYAIAFSATLLLLFLFIYLNHHFDGTYWQTMQQSKSALTAEYCELDQSTHFFRQTINTYSNLMYFFLGMISFLIGLYDRKNYLVSNQNPIQQFPSISILFGCCLMYLCFGSAFFHASLTWIGQRVDMNGTYSICISLIGISFYRLVKIENPSVIFQRLFIVFLVLTIMLFIEIHLLISSIILLPFLILLTTIFTIINYLRNRNNFNIQLAILSLLLMISAFILRTIDVKKIACNPTSIYQGHALWHIFTGMSAFMLYWFYRSEKA